MPCSDSEHAVFRLNDIGTLLQITIIDAQTNLPRDISSAIVLKLLLMKPSGALLEKAAEFVTDGTDGKIKYILVSGDLNEAGPWQIQGYIEIGSDELHSEIEEFTVEGNLN